MCDDMKVAVVRNSISYVGYYEFFGGICFLFLREESKPSKVKVILICNERERMGPE
jgi:hypothetical protein